MPVTSTSADDALAGRLIGCLRLERRLTAPGGGTATWQGSLMPVALPVRVRQWSGLDVDAALRRLRARAALADPHLLPVLAVETLDGDVFAAEDPGGETSLADQVAVELPWSAAAVPALLLPLLRALAALHAGGSVHGALAAGDCRTTAEGNLRLGLPERLRDGDTPAGDLAALGELIARLIADSAGAPADAAPPAGGAASSREARLWFLPGPWRRLVAGLGGVAAPDAAGALAQAQALVAAPAEPRERRLTVTVVAGAEGLHVFGETGDGQVHQRLVPAETAHALAARWRALAEPGTRSFFRRRATDAEAVCRLAAAVAEELLPTPLALACGQGGWHLEVAGPEAHRLPWPMLACSHERAQRDALVSFGEHLAVGPVAPVALVIAGAPISRAVALEPWGDRLAAADGLPAAGPFAVHTDLAPSAVRDLLDRRCPAWRQRLCLLIARGEEPIADLAPAAAQVLLRGERGDLGVALAVAAWRRLAAGGDLRAAMGDLHAIIADRLDAFAPALGHATLFGNPTLRLAVERRLPLVTWEG